jgi:AcrR family transcriptional regulator
VKPAPNLAGFERQICAKRLHDPFSRAPARLLTPTLESGSNDHVDDSLGNRSPARRTPRPTRAAGADQRHRQPRGNLRRQQILDAAVELFAAKGYRGTGVAALGDRVGMTATGLLYYFGSKERLLHEVVAERDRVDPGGPDGPSEPSFTLSSLRLLGQHNVETATLMRLYVVLGAESLDESDPLHEFFAQRYETAREFVRSILTAEKEQGRVRPDVDVDDMAREIIAVVMGLEIQWLTDPARVDLAQAMERYIDRLMKDLGPQELR